MRVCGAWNHLTAPILYKSVRLSFENEYAEPPREYSNPFTCPQRPAKLLKNTKGETKKQNVSHNRHLFIDEHEDEQDCADSLVRGRDMPLPKVSSVRLEFAMDEDEPTEMPAWDDCDAINRVKPDKLVLFNVAPIMIEAPQRAKNYKTLVVVFNREVEPFFNTRYPFPDEWVPRTCERVVYIYWTPHQGAPYYEESDLYKEGDKYKDDGKPEEYTMWR